MEPEYQCRVEPCTCEEPGYYCPHFKVHLVGPLFTLAKARTQEGDAARQKWLARIPKPKPSPTPSTSTQLANDKSGRMTKTFGPCQTCRNVPKIRISGRKPQPLFQKPVTENG